MGGGGFMDHAKITNNDHRSKMKGRREKHEKYNPTESILKKNPTHLSKEFKNRNPETFIRLFRKRALKRKQFEIKAWIVAILITAILCLYLFNRFFLFLEMAEG
ncbi:MAG: hypothetical protein N4A41_14125 [Crocinitomicaceae bacterium]|jgi:hypothetical protein|nr:hypothetical protein [Crocinitomicaceae bacterium]